MEHQTWLDFSVSMRRIGNLLGEITEISQQLSQAIDIDDPPTTRMLMAQRGETIERLMQQRAALREWISDISDPEAAQRMESLLRGDPQPREAEDDMAGYEASRCREKYKKLMELDRALSFKIARERSFYQDK